MKKIFTLITMAVMAMTAMAEDYNGALRISLGGSDPMEQEGVISVTENEGKYTLSLKDFSFGDLPVGNIVLEDIENTSTEEGVVVLKHNGTTSIDLMPGVPLPISLEATIDKNNLLTAHISITSVPGVNTVEVDFVPPVAYTGNLAIIIGEEEPITLPGRIEILKVSDTYTLILKNFSFGESLKFGDIKMDGIENTATEEGTIALAYEGMIELGGIGAMFAAMPIKLDATIDKADVLTANIKIKVPKVGDVSVSFTSTESTDISSVETEAGNGDEVVAIYDLQGRKVTDTNKKGIYILRKADGTTTKVYKK